MAQAKHDSITRRGLLSAAVAAVPVTIMPAAVIAAPASEPDPVFAAIAQHQRAYHDLGAVLDALASAEHAAWNAPRGQRRAANKRLAEAYAAERRFGNLLRNATDRFVIAIPQTLHGAVAALRYVRARFEQGYPMCEEDDYIALLVSTEHAICRAAGLPAPPA